MPSTLKAGDTVTWTGADGKPYKGEILSTNGITAKVRLVGTHLARVIPVRLLTPA